MKTFTRKHLALSIICLFTVFFSAVYAADIEVSTFSTQTSSGLWSSSSQISVDSSLAYVNKGQNSSIIWNYFTWFYYDSVLWYFETDWSSSGLENVRIVGSTGACPSWYGYKLGWYAYSNAFGFIDFDYDSNNFVYYCIGDGELHGYAYSTVLWFQNFEGLAFDINVDATILVTEEPTGTGTFTNDTTNITDIPDAEAENSNFTEDSIQNDVIDFDVKYESLFYIVK